MDTKSFGGSSTAANRKIGISAGFAIAVAVLIEWIFFNSLMGYYIAHPIARILYIGLLAWGLIGAAAIAHAQQKVMTILLLVLFVAPSFAFAVAAPFLILPMGMQAMGPVMPQK